MDRVTAAYLRDIIIEEMNIPSERIWVRDQNVVIPNDEDIFIAVGMVDSQVMSVRNIPIEEGEDLQEKQRVTMRENIQIDIHSRNTDAISRNWEILAALNSIYAYQVQDENNFRINSLPTSFVNTSGTEGAENINKFSITVPCFVWYSKQKAISTVNGDWYDNFDTRVDDENTIGQDDGLFEFNIQGETIT